MKLIDYINKCVDNYVEMTPGGDRNLRILVDCSKKIGYGFVQIGGAVYIPNSKYSTFDGIFMRSSDLVDGWEEFDDLGRSALHDRCLCGGRRSRGCRRSRGRTCRNGWAGNRGSRSGRGGGNGSLATGTQQPAPGQAAQPNGRQTNKVTAAEAGTMGCHLFILSVLDIQ